ncbi:hypothetical protein [Sphingomonas sp.]|uniref:hypothetical protein n=1 Tax=Sphingomonas sp. TaxID=28214 RepID=UPI003F6EB614
MDVTYLPEFDGAYLEDSYFLGFVAEGANLRFRCLFALTTGHANYAPPLNGDQHCYREGSILVERASIVDWKAGNPAVLQDSDGTFDLGSIELYRRAPNAFRVVTEWFEALVETENISLELT